MNCVVERRRKSTCHEHDAPERWKIKSIGLPPILIVSDLSVLLTALCNIVFRQQFIQFVDLSPKFDKNQLRAPEIDTATGTISDLLNVGHCMPPE